MQIFVAQVKKLAELVEDKDRMLVVDISKEPVGSALVITDSTNKRIKISASGIIVR